MLRYKPLLFSAGCDDLSRFAGGSSSCDPF